MIKKLELEINENFPSGVPTSLLCKHDGHTRLCKCHD